MMKELKPIYDTQKSFYGKAQVEATTDTATLYSYGTAIMTYNKVDDDLTLIWGDWSRTTGRHINEFLKQYTNINGMNKKEYLKKFEEQAE
ncbi:MAG: hypothetical protein PT942_03130 [Eubacteriales bacterium]|nr:hypothetical protein [Eubacteriales bacterium]